MDVLAQDIGGDATRRSLGPLRRYWWLVLLGALVGLVAGAAGLTLAGKQYTATATVEVFQPPNQDAVNNARTNSRINMDNELQFMQSAQVGHRAQQLLASKTSVAELQKDMTAVVPANTSFLDVSFTARSRDKAAYGAHAFAQAYLDVRSDQAKASVAANQNSLTTDLNNQTAALARWSAIAAGSVATSAVHANAIAQVRVLQQSIANLNGRLAPLSAINTSAGAIVDDATPPGKPSKPVTSLYVGTGLFLGLMLGLGLALLAARRDRWVRNPQDVTSRAGRPVIASIPGPHRGTLTATLLTADAGSGEFDRLRLRLDSATPDRAASVVVTSPRPGAAAGFVAANLAASMARAGSDVVLLCTDPTSPAATILDLPEGPGLAGALTEGHSPTEVAVPVLNRPRLRAVPPGRDLAGALGKVSIQQVVALVDTLVSNGHRVVIEAAAVSAGTDAQELARRSGSALVAVESTKTAVPAVKTAFDELEQVGALVPGAVVVPALSEPTRAAASEDVAFDRAEATAQSRH
jgi:polysaccharide biosynthesis transport protein